jgi:NAD(P)-dependent dehydrogenase (short-subunit alcohol dehydrogenase family)
MDPHGKVAVVSGGASGLGAATAAALADAGAQVAVLDPAIPSPAFHHFPCDVTDAAQTESAVAAVCDRLGHIDICINCAGIGGLGPIATPEGPQDLDAFRRVIDVNLIGTVNLTRFVAHRMIGNAGDGPDGERGVIINAASIASFEGQQGMGAYTASKAAVAALTLVWARDLSAHRIRVMSIAAGFFATPMTAGMPDDLVEELLETVEFPKRPGRPEEFARTALFIVQNVLLNGEVIRLDGATRPPARTKWTAPAGVNS